MLDSPGPVTVLLNDLRNGKREAETQLLPLVYEELRRVASHYLRGERQGHTMQTTDLVHEAYLKLAGQQCPWENRAHFFGVAAQAMRHILVDHARARYAGKRGGGQARVPLDDALLVSGAPDSNLLELDEALTKLARRDPRQARIVELRYFAGLSVEEVAEVLGCVSRTVNRDWRMAQAWLRRELESGGLP